MATAPDLSPIFKRAHPMLRELGALHKIAAVRARMDGIPIKGDMDFKNALFTMGYKLAMHRARRNSIMQGISVLGDLFQREGSK